MLDKFRQFLESKIPLNADEWEKIRLVCMAKNLDKGDFLLKEGETWRHIALVLKGCIRTYRRDNTGKIRILNFVVENNWAGDTQSLQHNTPSLFDIDAVEPSEIVLINKWDFDLLCKEMPHLNQMMTDSLKECLSSSLGRVDLATTITAEEKYVSFSTYHSELLLRLPQYMIASYLGITPESLSRIRKKLATEPVADKVLI